MPSKNKTSVQNAFNKAVVERDGRCVICGRSEGVQLQCSHFFPVGSHSGLRFHPDNAYCMCARCHISHHQRDPYLYVKWFQKNKPLVLTYIDSVKNEVVHYDQPLLESILRCVKGRNFLALRGLLTNELQGSKA
jgi:hypothetical protein